MSDGVDYVPARSFILLGHHFASIAGAAPIVGPIIAIGFGWLPVYLWVLIGAAFFGSVHDYVSIVASIRHKGKSIGYIVQFYLGNSGKKLFLLFTWFTLILLIAVFTSIVSTTFASIPSAGSSSILFIILALLFGLSIYKFKLPFGIASVAGVLLLVGSIILGNFFPIYLSAFQWQIIIFIYIFIASVTPVWILLQPRDYLNSFLLYALILLGVAGLFFANPTIKFATFNSFEVKNLGFLFPVLFVTVACGAISGFHSLVGSGTTSKQLNKETDARLIGFGGMLIEGLLATLSLIAVATLEPQLFITTLRDNGPVTVFSVAVANFIESIPLLNIPHSYAKIFVALSVSAFALTSLDTATRLARYAFQEFFENLKLKEQSVLVKNRYISSAITVFVVAVLTLSGQSMSIWPIFGSANQLLAALALLALSIWLYKSGKNAVFTLIPMAFMFLVTTASLSSIIYSNLLNRFNLILLLVSILLLILSIIISVQAYKLFISGMKDIPADIKN